MQGNSGRLAVLIGGSALAVAGYGAVLPYLYPDVANARGLGGFAAAGMYTTFALGSLVATPLAGRLADRGDPVRVATVARLGVALAVLALAFAPSVATVWLSAAVYGGLVAATQPSIQVILLAWTPERRRRDVFAWQFIGNNLALAAGGLAGGFLVDLSSPAGMLPIFYISAAASVVSAVVVWAVARGGCPVGAEVEDVGAGANYRTLLGVPAIRWLLGITLLLMLACYAQYESGLPAYALGSLHVSPKVLGVAVAINAVAVAVLTAPVLAATRRRDPAALLAACGWIWIGCWTLLALPLLHLPVHIASTPVLVVAGYTAFSMGETMLSPVLTPLAAALAPEGAAGQTLAAVSGATTLATAIGPALSGVLLALHLPLGFVALQLICCLGAIAATPKLRARHRALVAASSGS